MKVLAFIYVCCAAVALIVAGLLLVLAIDGR
jgi:hypothetical protein